MLSSKRLFTLFLLCVSAAAYPAEFAIMNQTITLTSANNGFYFSYDLNKGPVNWVSPDNFRDGLVYFRYEMVSMPTSNPSYFSFDIWGDYDSETKSYSESAAPICEALSASGAVVTFSSSPKNWYNHAVNGSVNWYNRNTFWRWGICHWFSKSPNYLLAPKNWSNSSESWEAWTHNSDWLPVTIKVTIVAVSQGSTFSGWSNYTSGSGGTKHPTPDYGIDYTAETTNKIVPSTDEYSLNSNMSGAVSGTGQKITLTPGQDVYFRKKASSGYLASDIQHLDVPSRPSLPAITIDFVNEVTSAIPSTMEYSLSSSMSSAAAGSNAGVDVTPGTDLYIRKKATSSQFKSNIQTLTVPSRPAVPAITIDYLNEQTSAVANTMEYATNISMSSPVTGSNAAVALTPGTDLYIRERATSSQFRSGIQTLDVPARPGAPVITIDFLNEKTSSFANTIEYSANINMSGAVSGNNSQVLLTPGTDLYFRYKATASQFSSQIQSLDVPERPAKPAIGINYQTEKTASYITSDLEYDDNSEMASPAAGEGVYLNLSPGQNIYIRRKADVSHFSSDVLELIVPSRPTGPIVTIDYINERTADLIASDLTFSLNSDMSGPTNGPGDYVTVVPGTDMYFRTNYSDSTFISQVYHLIVPQRPVISSSAGSIVDAFFMASLHFDADTAGLGKDGIEAVNAEIHQNGLDLIIDPVSEGEVRVRVKANAILTGNFASDDLVTVYDIGTGMNEVSDEFINVYPNPAETDFINITIDRTLLPSDLQIIDLNGTVLYGTRIYSSVEKVSLEKLGQGAYILRIKTCTGNSIVKKLIRK